MTSSSPSPGRRPQRPWPVTVVMIHLLIQAAGLFSLSALRLAGPWPGPGWSPEVVAAGLRGLAFGALGVVAGWAAVGFWRLWRQAWLGATFLQSMGLLLALGLYWQSRPWYSYIMMAYGIFVVVYLNQAEVLAVFRPSALSLPTPELDE